MLVLFSVVAAPVAAESPNTDPPADPVDRAEKSLKSADLESLVSILEPVAEGKTTTDRPARADILYALGLVYLARQSEDSDGDLQQRADHHIERALSEDSDLELDPLLYPPRFIARVDEFREDSPSRAVPDAESPEIFYFERRIEIRSKIPLYLPGGAGQFYNDSPVKGVLFAVVQALGLAANATGFWMVRSLRDDDGFIPSDRVRRARGWRGVQYGGIALFGLSWLVGVVESHLDFERETVRIRMLDDPPDEFAPFPD